MSVLALAQTPSRAASAVELAYVAAAVLLIVGLKRLSRVPSATSGNRLAALGIAVAVAATLVLLRGHVSLWLIGVGLLVGAVLGYLLAVRAEAAALPELVALLNGLGGAASACVGLAAAARFIRAGPPDALAEEGLGFAAAVVASVLVGWITLSGSLVARAKLAGRPGRIHGERLAWLGARRQTVALALAAIALCAWGAFVADQPVVLFVCFGLLTVVSLALGIGLVVPIGAADMPVAVALLDACSGIAVSATGFVLQNNLLIVAGTLIGASGLVVAQLLCKGLNRSLASVLFGPSAAPAAAPASAPGQAAVESATAEELAPILDAARTLIVVPGYGLAVAQAQHRVRELADLLGKRGCQVRYAIHPAAGRMPGHMNALLAMADVPYEQLFDRDRINGDFGRTDVVLVVGASDVCNPAARDQPGSPIHGMPVLDVSEARTVIVIKRTLAPGHAGVANPLLERANTLLFLADAEHALADLIAAVQEL